MISVVVLPSGEMYVCCHLVWGNVCMLSSSLGFLDQFSPARYRLQYEMCGEKGLGNMTVLQIRSLGKVLKAIPILGKIKVPTTAPGSG